MKRNILIGVLMLLFLAVFNVVFFLAGVAHTEANWCSYGFITVAYFFLIATPLFAKGSKEAVLTGSLWLQATGFFIMELIVGSIFIACNLDKITWPLIVQSIILAVFLAKQIFNVMANDATTASISQQREQSFARQALVDSLRIRARAATDANVKKSIFGCVEALEASPIQSYPDAYDAEMHLKESVKTLADLVDAGVPFEKIQPAAAHVLAAIGERSAVINRCRITSH